MATSAANHTGDWTGLVWGVTDARGITTMLASTFPLI